MDNILLATLIIGVIVVGVTQMIKRTAINNKWLPFLNVLFGLIIGISYALMIIHGEIATYAWAGMSAGGFYDLSANGKSLYKETKINEGDDEK